jgi:hypothetical protein
MHKCVENEAKLGSFQCPLGEQIGSMVKLSCMGEMLVGERLRPVHGVLLMLRMINVRFPFEFASVPHAILI